MNAGSDEHPRYVYFAGSDDMVKIGCSSIPIKRLESIAEWVPFRIQLLATMPGGFDVESAVHAMFTEEWQFMEWFQLSPRLRAFIADVREGGPVIIPEKDRAPYFAKRCGIRKKKALSRSVTTARHKAFGNHWSARAENPVPPSVLNAIDEYSGGNVIEPSPKHVAIIQSYIESLSPNQSFVS